MSIIGWYTSLQSLAEVFRRIINGCLQQDRPVAMYLSTRELFFFGFGSRYSL